MPFRLCSPGSRHSGGMRLTRQPPWKCGIRSMAPAMEAVSIPEVVDIEESIWVPRYGLKGMIDASVQLRCQPVGPHGPMLALQASRCF